MRKRPLVLGAVLLSAVVVGAGVYGQQLVRTGWADARGKKLGVTATAPQVDANRIQAQPPVFDITPSPGFAKREFGAGDLWKKLEASPGDLEVIVHGTGDDELSRPFETLDEEVRAYLNPNRGVAIVKATGVRSELRHGVAATTLDLHVEEILQNTPQHGLRVPMKIRGEVHGGVFEAGGKIAVVRRPDQQLPREGHRYIWSFFDCADSVCSVGDSQIEIDGDALRYGSSRQGGHFERSGAPIVLNDLKAAAQRKGGAR